MIEHKTIQFKADEADAFGRTIAGYGSVFGNTDLGGDVVMPGAFAESLASGRKVKMLWNHRSDDLLGVWDEMAEDEKGLRVSGRVAETALGNDVSALLKMGAIDSLSIGYRTIESEYKGETRLIQKAELWEVSLVVFPMNTLATIDSVKAAEMSAREIEERLRDAGFSRNAAKKLISGGYDALSAQRDADESKSEILDLLKQRVSFLNSNKESR